MILHAKEQKPTKMAKALDIWNALEQHVNLSGDEAIVSAVVYLDRLHPETSYIHVNYFNTATVLSPREAVQESPLIRKFEHMPAEIVYQMMESLRSVIDLPTGVMSLHTFLDDREVPHMVLKMIPQLKAE